MTRSVQRLAPALLRRLRAAAARVAAAPPAHWLVRAIRRDPIFQIGFNKCGTTSLHHFLLASGLRSLHWEGGILAERMAARIDAGQDPIRDFPRAVGFTDTVSYRGGKLVEPYKSFEYLHRWYPDALFILNTRDRENWVASRAAHETGGQTLTVTYGKLLGIPERDVADYWRAEWDDHHARVRQYFGQAPNFLEFDIERDDPAKLVSFIARLYPRCAGVPFESRNRRAEGNAR